MRNHRLGFLPAAVLLIAGVCAAQPLVLELPGSSQRATVSQR